MMQTKCVRLGDYKGIKVSLAVTDDDVQQEIDGRYRIMSRMNRKRVPYRKMTKYTLNLMAILMAKR